MLLIDNEVGEEDEFRMISHTSLCLFAAITTCAAASPKIVGVKPELFSEAKTIAAGQTFTVALSLKHEKGYHTYWDNPGTVGFATSLKWDLPEGFAAGEIQWQVPERCEMVTIYNSHGYAGDTLLLVDITAPESLPDSPVVLKAEGAWMACGAEPGECCNVGFKDFTLTLNTGLESEWNESAREEIAEARRKLPRPIEGWDHSCKRIGDHLVLEVKSTAGLSLKAAEDIYFYSKLNHIDTLVEQGIQIEGDKITVTLSIADFAPKEIEKLVGLFYHPDDWPGAEGQKYMPIDLKLE